MFQISNFNTFGGQFNRLDQHGASARVFPMPQQQQQVKSTKAYKTNFAIFCYTSGIVRNFKKNEK
jgi:hypothetical protein